MQLRAAVYSAGPFTPASPALARNATPRTHRRSMPIGTGPGSTHDVDCRTTLRAWLAPPPQARADHCRSRYLVDYDQLPISVYRRIRSVRFAEFVFTGSIDFGFLRRFPAPPSRAIGPGHLEAARPSRVDSVEPEASRFRGPFQAVFYRPAFSGGGIAHRS